MKTPILSFTFFVIVIYVTGGVLSLDVAASPPFGGNGAHFCRVTDNPLNKQHSDQFPNRHYAQSFAANLNVGDLARCG